MVRTKCGNNDGWGTSGIGAKSIFNHGCYESNGIMWCHGRIAMGVVVCGWLWVGGWEHGAVEGEDIEMGRVPTFQV